MQPATEIRNERSAGELYWREYWIEAGALATFMLAACVFGVLLEHPSSAAHQSIDAPLLRRALMGAAMGLTAVAIISSHWGQRSGAHMNPALTLTYWALGKIRSRDALLYVAFQFLGGAAGVAAAAAVIGPPLGDAAVDFVATRPGPDGAGAAFAAELGISTLLMGTVLVTSNSPRLAHSTPLFAGALVALYITLETPLSGMSVNPARTLASALFAGDYRSLWIYFTAPPAGMLLAALLYRAARGAVLCAKLHPCTGHNCIFNCRAGELL